MAIEFVGQTTTQFGGGNGGRTFEDIPGASKVLAGILYDCKAFTPDAGDYPTWTIYYKFIRAIVPYYAPLNADGTIGTPERGAQRGGGRDGFIASGLLLAPPGYVVTGINIRWDSVQGRDWTMVKAFQLAFAQWTARGVSSSNTTLSPWQGGDGQIKSNSSSHYGPGDINAVANAPTNSETGKSVQFAADRGGCFIGLIGRNGDLIDALGGVWAVPRMI